MALGVTPSAAANVSGWYAGIYGAGSSPASVDFGFDIISAFYSTTGTIEQPSSFVNSGGADPVLFDFLNTSIEGFPFADFGSGLGMLTEGRLDLLNALSYGAVVGYGLGNGVRVEADISSASFLTGNYAPLTGSQQGLIGTIDPAGVWTWTKAFDMPLPSPPPPPVPMSFFGLEYQLDVQFMLVSGYYDFDTGTAFTPYLGGGAGLARVTGTLTDLCGCGTFSTSMIAPAAQIGGGVRIVVAEPVTLDLGYRYKMAMTSGVGVEELLYGPGPSAFGFIAEQSGVIGVHTLQAGLTFALP